MRGFVLVHGGGHGAWCWERMLPHLELPALAVDLPGHGARGGGFLGHSSGRYADDVVAQIRASGIDDVILVGPSMAGLVIPAVAARIADTVTRLVFISCGIPPEGMSHTDAQPHDVQPQLRAALEAAIRDGDGGNVIPEAAARAYFCNDMDDEQTRFVLDHLKPVAAPILLEKVSRRDMPRHIPRTWVRLLSDDAVTPERAAQSIEWLGGAEVVDLDAGHDAMISRPKELAGILHALARP